MKLGSIPKPTPKAIARGIKEYVIITFALCLYAFAWIGIVMQAEIIGGGITGLSMLIFYATGGEAGAGIPIGYSFLAMNAVLITIASFIIGFKFSAKTIYSVFMLTFLMNTLQTHLPPNILGLGHDVLLSALLGGALGGVAVAIVFLQGGSMGGTDIIAMIVNKFRSVSYGRVLMFCDFIIIGASYFINWDITTVIYSYIVVAVAGYAIDAVMAGNRQSSQVFIMSPKYDKIADQVTGQMHRGVTLLDGESWYTKENKKVLMVVCRKSETGVLFRIVKDVDPAAFITVANVMGVYGRGFEQLRTNVKNKKKRQAAV